MSNSTEIENAEKWLSHGAIAPVSLLARFVPSVGGSFKLIIFLLIVGSVVSNLTKQCGEAANAGWERHGRSHFVRT